MAVNGATITDEACEEFPAITLDKDVTSGPTALGGGRYEMVYTLTATNSGAGDGTYSLTDELTFGAGITIDSVSPGQHGSGLDRRPTPPGTGSRRPQW